MAKRTGIPRLSTLAQLLCAALNKYAASIALTYPDNPSLLAALSAAQAACVALHMEAEKVREQGV